MLHINSNVWTFLVQTIKDIESMSIGKISNFNLSEAHRTTLDKLSNNPGLAIKPSDKGGNVVLMDALSYRNMCWDILKNRLWYKPISVNVITRFNQQYNDLLQSALANGLITKEIFKGIQVPYSKVPTFYSLPKIHKHFTKPPGRPVSSIGSKTERASRFVHEYLCPHVITLPSYVKDTPDLLKNLEGLTVPQACSLVTIYVETLYSSMPHELGLETMETN